MHSRSPDRLLVRPRGLHRRLGVVGPADGEQPDVVKLGLELEADLR